MFSGKNKNSSSINDLYIDSIDKRSKKKDYHKVRETQRTDLHIVPFNANRKDIIDGYSIRENLMAEWDNEHLRKEKIVAIGINPSTAHNGKSDTTMTKLCRFLDMYGFNNVTMLNLFESVSSHQNKIYESTRTDFNRKREVLESADIILLVWGLSGHVNEKKEAMTVLTEYADGLYCIRNPKGRYPVHPSRMPYKSAIMPMISIQDFIVCGMKG